MNGILKTENNKILKVSIENLWSCAFQNEQNINNDALLKLNRFNKNNEETVNNAILEPNNNNIDNKNNEGDVNNGEIL